MGLVGLLPILTATIRFCPAYLPFSRRTCRPKSDGRTGVHPVLARPPDHAMNFWDERYGAAAEGHVFGTEPNDFLAAHAHLIPAGPVLCLPATPLRQQYLDALTQLQSESFEPGLKRLIAVLEAKPGYDDGQAKAVCIALFRHLRPRHALTEKFSRAFSRAVNV